MWCLPQHCFLELLQRERRIGKGLEESGFVLAHFIGFGGDFACDGGGNLDDAIQVGVEQVALVDT